MHAIAQCQSVMLPSRDNRSNNVTLSFPLCPADGASLLKNTVQTLTLGSLDVLESFILEVLLLCHYQQFIFSLEF